MVRLIYHMSLIYNLPSYAFENKMPRKRITWIGSVVILGAGIFCFWALSQSRTKFLPAGTRFHLVTVGAFVALAVTALAIFLWYYFNEKH